MLHIAAACLGPAFLAGCSTTGGNGLVAIRAQADPTYLAHRAEPPSHAAQSYVFVKGRFFPSPFDGQITPVDFTAITKTLAADLAPRFMPAPSTREADLVIVVHWGAVEGRENASDSLFYDVGSLNRASDGVDAAREQAAAGFKAGNYAAYGQVRAAEAAERSELGAAESVFSANSRATATSADLIGLRGLHRNNDNSAEADQLRSLLEDDRFFVTLVAYDARGLKLNQKWVAWTARMSVPVAGRDFAGAVKDMGAVAAPYFGTEQPSMVLKALTVAEQTR